MKRDEIKQLERTLAAFPGARYQTLTKSGGTRERLQIEYLGRSSVVVKANIHKDGHGFRNFLGDVRRFCKGVQA